jgi:two-component system LytT family response regulator
MNTIIVDDELNAIKMLNYHLTEYFKGFKILDTFTNIDDAFAFILKNNIDVLFLDINMPNGSGIDLLNKIQDKNIKTIFTTAHTEYAIDAIKGNAFDYLLKPISLDELNRIHTKLINNLEKKILSPKELDYITIKISSKHYRYEIDDIILISSEGNYSTIHFKNEKNIVITKNLKKMEEEFFNTLPFFRIHQSNIININHIKSFCTQEIELSNNLKSLVSLKKYDQLLNTMENLL